MVVSRGGISGGLTIADALREFEARGYIGQFAIREGGAVECMKCNTRHAPREMELESMRRIEGASDPADMAFVGALHCPRCGNHGTAVIGYGPNADPAHGAVLRELKDHRLSHDLNEEGPDDSSLVRDTGWLRGPDDRPQGE